MKNIFFLAGLFVLVSSCAAFGQTANKLTLQDAINTALLNNPAIVKARQEVQAASARVLQEGRIPNPEIGVTWSEVPSSFHLGNANERDFTFSQQIEFPTKRSGRVNIASVDVRISELRHERKKILLTAGVKKAYYDRLLSDAIVTNHEGQIGLLTDFQALLLGQYQSGGKTYLDVVRTKVEVARLKNDLVESRRERRAKTAQLNLLLGKESQAPLALSDTLTAVPMPANRDSLLSASLNQSSSLSITQGAVARQEENLSLAKSSYLPDLGIGLARQRRGDVGNLWGVELTMSLPLWFWQEPKGRVEEASVALSISKTEESAAQRRIRASILGAFDLALAAESQLRTFNESLLLDSQDILSTAITQYRNNQLDVLNVLDVYRTYRATTLEYVRALHGYVVALAELEASAELPFENETGDK